ncbi:MAG: beta strand repeat-containing protein, partial [Candidatus Aquicultor sp.]
MNLRKQKQQFIFKENIKSRIFILGGFLAIGFLFFAGVNSVVAKTFNIFNAAVPTTSYFLVDGTTGNVGIGTTGPLDSFSIGNSGAAPAGSSKTGHNYTSTYLSSDAYALTNYGLVQTLIANATSTLVAGNLWNGTLNGNIYNGTAGAGNVGIGTTAPLNPLHVLNTSAGVVVDELKLTNLSGTAGTGVAIAFNPSELGANVGNLFGKIIVAKINGVGDYTTRMDLNVANGNGVAVTGLSILGQAGASTVGNVGIGTTAPLAKLQVNDATFPQVRIQNDNSAAPSGETGIRFRTQGTEGVAHADIGWTGTGSDTGNMVFRVPYNSERMRIQSNGYVGIGTTAPGAMLQVTKDEDGAFGAGAGIIIQNPDANGTGGASALRFMRVGATKWALVNDVDGNATDNLTFWGQGGIKAITFQATTGNVGVGTTGPLDTFSIGNAGAAPAGSAKTGHNYTSTYLSTDDYALTNYGLVKTLIGNATSTLIAGNLWNGTLNGNIYNGTAGAGNVGIGTTNPGSKLDIQAARTAQLTLLKLSTDTLSSAVNDEVSIDFNRGNAKNTGRISGYIADFSTYDSGLKFYVAPLGTLSATPAMMLKYDGNVGIGLTNPLNKLDVDGNIIVGRQLDTLSRYIGKSTAAGAIGGNQSTSWMGFISDATNDYITFGTHHSGVSAGERVRINSDGNVGIGTTNPIEKLNIVSGAGIGLGSALNNGGSFVKFQGSNTNQNWLVGNQWNGAYFEITPSTAGGGTTYSTPAMVILNNGNVGIGTGAPLQPLHVA